MADALVAAVIGRARGLKGEVYLDVRTDRAEDRFVIGATFETDPASAGPLTLQRIAPGSPGLLATFEEASDRTAAEALRGVQLLVQPDTEDDAWYPHELQGLKAFAPDGEELGQIDSVEFGHAQDLLVVERPGGGQARVPLVAAFVPVIDVAGGRVVIDAPSGLFED